MFLIIPLPNCLDFSARLNKMATKDQNNILACARIPVSDIVLELWSPKINSLVTWFYAIKYTQI